MARPDPTDIAAALGAPAGGSSGSTSGDPGSGSGSDLEAAMGDLLDAIDAKDPKAMAEAFRHATQLADDDSGAAGGGEPAEA